MDSCYFPPRQCFYQLVKKSLTCCFHFDSGLIKLLLEPADARSIFLSHCNWKSKQQSWILRQSLHCLSSLATACGPILFMDGGIDVIQECISGSLPQDLLQIAISIVTNSVTKDTKLAEAFGSSGIIMPLVDIYGNESNSWETHSTAALAIGALCTGGLLLKQKCDSVAVIRQFSSLLDFGEIRLKLHKHECPCQWLRTVHCYKNYHLIICFWRRLIVFSS